MHAIRNLKEVLTNLAVKGAGFALERNKLQAQIRRFTIGTLHIRLLHGRPCAKSLRKALYIIGDDDLRRVSLTQALQVV